MNSVVYNQKHHQQCFSVLADWVSSKSVYDNPEGMDQVRRDIHSRFQAAGFDVQRIENPQAAHRPILICRRQGERPGCPTIGFFGHYDVEPAVAEDWETDPWTLTEHQGRWYGRGVGDNLLPLLQRLLLFGTLFREVDVLYVLQGEEEMRGPFAHTLFPTLDLGKVDLWMEETGYFYRDGRQRLLTLHDSPLLQRAVDAVTAVLVADGREWTQRHRTLSKVIHGERCPCHVHLLRSISYLAIGPNDDSCNIHNINESMDPQLLEISALQLQALSTMAGEFTSAAH